MAARDIDIYEIGSDEDIRAESNVNKYRKCVGQATTNAVETVCLDCGFVIHEQRTSMALKGKLIIKANETQPCVPPILISF